MNQPNYYRLLNGSFNTIELIEDRCSQLSKAYKDHDLSYLGFLYGNIIKYIMRFPLKGGVDDLVKASIYIDLLISQLKED
jgi:hypothetical protein